MTKIGYRYQYRVNKKGAECFRTDSYEDAKAKLKELRAKKPNVRFDMQKRYIRVNRVGAPELDWLGRPWWSPWHEI